MMKSPVNHLSPAKQFLLFVAVFAGVFVACNILGFVVIAVFFGLKILTDIGTANFSNPQTLRALYILQILAMTLPIFLGPWVFSKWVVKNTEEYLRTNKRFHLILLALVFVIMMVSVPLIEVLGNFNQGLVLPKWLKGLEDWMRASEKAAELLTAAILKMNTIWDVIKNVILLGVLTAIAEEIMFRGVLQTILHKWTKNIHASIWIGAALFSAFHMEFYGFLPRMLLGGIFGYLVAYSGSIWPAIWGHFLNNSTIVVVTYLYQKNIITLNPEDTNVFNTPIYLFSLIIIIILLIVYKKVALDKKLNPVVNGEKLG
ncbi:CPBP family intramembrane metalloprotease [Mucilaginibacter terrigena]|uniref:CPBP family intramembrane metalloprotease n=1 Tax=Mucilaginibacter terrigena TaxID=2492395 RepID=A0A4Q5LJ42_9SPHI|nr:type II CAAX endopeptidase family protein [Mucilaginibacter terrigena]RYU89398.1 CPBP family intramembrane metalloprotease [Mucilaginibacter terrigena]